MSRISAEKLTLFNQAMQELYAAAWAGKLPETLPAILAMLVPGEVMIFNSLGAKTPSLDLLWTAPLLPNWPAVLGAVAAFGHEHPGIGRRSTAQSVSDYLSRSEWQRTGAYAEIMRQFGLEDDLGIDIPIRPGVIISLCQQRSRWRFPQEERLLIDLLAPHLRQAWLQSERMARSSLAGGLPERLEEALGHGVLRVDERGRVLDGSAQTRARMERFAGKMKSGRLLPAIVSDWFHEERRRARENRLGENPHQLMRLVVGEATLRVQFVVDPARSDYFLILEEEAAPPTPALLRPMGLSAREQEVLFWVAQGKTNKAVAQILGISVRTIKRHLENIYARLQVDGRHAASHSAQEYLRGAVS